MANGQQQMGIGVLGDRNIVFKRKFRWTFTVTDICGNLKLPSSFVKIASRPNLSIEETEINYLNARTYIPGKATWNTMTVTYIDVANISGIQGGIPGGGNPAHLFTWLQSVYDFRSVQSGAKANQVNMGSRRSNYSANGLLQLFDGCGGLLEDWNLVDVWPTEVNFGDLDMGSSETADIELTLRYTTAEYTPYCGTPPPPPCCTPCS